MVETQSKSAIQAPAERPPLRVPPKRTFSEAQGALATQSGTEQPKEVKEPLRPAQRRRSNPPQPKLDAKAMMKLVPALSERELKQLVNTILRRKKREEGARSRRPSELTAARGTTTVEREPTARTSRTATTVLPPSEQRSFVELAPTPKESTLGPGGPLSTFESQEMKTRRESHKAEESVLAGALLRQASRLVFSLYNIFFTYLILSPTILEYLYLLYNLN